MGGSRWEKLFPHFEYRRSAPGDPSLSHRHSGHVVPATVRVRSQEEVVVGLSEREALEECRRCLRCDLRVTPNGN